VGALPGPDRDARVFRSLWGVFRALEAAGAGAPADADADADAPAAVSASELREALSGSAAARFELGDMHDAAEVLGEMLECLHRAEAGGGGADPTLPRQVAVPAGEARGWAAPLAPPPPPPPPRRQPSPAGSAGGSPPGAGSVWGSDSATMSRVRRAPPPPPGKGATLVQRLFGLEVQVASAAAPPASASAPTVLCDQFTKYFHLVAAQGLREAAPAAPCFEAALLAADAGGPAPAARLLSRPRVLTLALVWESAGAAPAAIGATLRAVGTQLAAGALFAGAADAGVYRLRGVVCYSRSHYSAFALSEELGAWLLLDDAHVSVVGGWAEVGAAVVARRLQPSLLFYEAGPAEA
jgi:hypothetical protein